METVSFSAPRDASWGILTNPLHVHVHVAISSVPGRGESGYVEAEIVLAMSLSIVFDLWGPPSLVTTKFGSPSLVLCFIFTRVCVYIYTRGAKTSPMGCGGMGWG